MCKRIVTERAAARNVGYIRFLITLPDSVSIPLQRAATRQFANETSPLDVIVEVNWIEFLSLLTSDEKAKFIAKFGMGIA